MNQGNLQLPVPNVPIYPDSIEECSLEREREAVAQVVQFTCSKSRHARRCRIKPLWNAHFLTWKMQTHAVTPGTRENTQALA